MKLPVHILLLKINPACGHTRNTNLPRTNLVDLIIVDIFMVEQNHVETNLVDFITFGLLGVEPNLVELNPDHTK